MLGERKLGGVWGAWGFQCHSTSPQCNPGPQGSVGSWTSMPMCLQLRLNDTMQSRASLHSSIPATPHPSHIPPALIFASEEAGGEPVSTQTWHLTMPSEFAGGRDSWHLIAFFSGVRGRPSLKLSLHSHWRRCFECYWCLPFLERWQPGQSGRWTSTPCIYKEVIGIRPSLLQGWCGGWGDGGGA